MRINMEEQILSTYKKEISREKNPAAEEFMPEELC